MSDSSLWQLKRHVLLCEQQLLLIFRYKTIAQLSLHKIYINECSYHFIKYI